MSGRIRSFRRIRIGARASAMRSVAWTSADREAARTGATRFHPGELITGECPLKTFCICDHYKVLRPVELLYSAIECASVSTNDFRLAVVMCGGTFIIPEAMKLSMALERLASTVVQFTVPLVVPVTI